GQCCSCGVLRTAPPQNRSVRRNPAVPHPSRTTAARGGPSCSTSTTPKSFTGSVKPAARQEEHDARKPRAANRETPSRPETTAEHCGQKSGARENGAVRGISRLEQRIAGAWWCFPFWE